MYLPLTITPIIPALKDLSLSDIFSTNTDQFPPPPFNVSFWVFEPVCGIFDMGGDDDDDSDSDSDLDDDTSSNSFQSSSGSSPIANASNLNSPTIDPKSNNCNSKHEEENTRMTTVSINTVPTAIYEEVVGDDSSSSLSSPTELDFPMIKLKTADPREST
ncbi:unnamed protein product [Ceratitis capitata]|uniref:(Mediterranean fruit fly) hypothetical protein n=1 Tax=Ceratitis capitata TaxID=7213 RepID=A0A811UQP7_CERCA|nr:unnamed protein product [Ceratitis capitata]